MFQNHSITSKNIYPDISLGIVVFPRVLQILFFLQYSYQYFRHFYHNIFPVFLPAKHDICEEYISLFTIESITQTNSSVYKELHDCMNGTKHCHQLSV